MSTDVATILTTQKGAAGVYPSSAPRIATPEGTATNKAGKAIKAACLIEAEERPAYAPKAGARRNQDMRKGSAVVSALPSALPWFPRPMAVVCCQVSIRGNQTRVRPVSAMEACDWHADVGRFICEFGRVSG